MLLQGAAEHSLADVSGLWKAGPNGSLTQTDSLACGSHKLLGATPAPQRTAATDGEGTAAKAHPAAVLLGLTDDVDAAMVRVAVGADGRIEARHLATVPALGYVAAGKVQKRAVLFGMPGNLLHPLGQRTSWVSDSAETIWCRLPGNQFTSQGSMQCL